MDAFRLILIIAALVIVAAIWFWGRRRRANDDPLGLSSPRGEDDDDVLMREEFRRLSGLIAEEREERGGNAGAGADDHHAPLDDLDEGVVGPARIVRPTQRSEMAPAAPEALRREPQQPMRQDEPSAPSAGAPPVEPRHAPRTEPRVESPQSQEFIALYVIAPQGERYSGEAILAAAELAQLRHGEMNIFHRYPSGRAEPRARFSVANMFEPGSFPPAQMATLTTPGLALFMQLYLPADDQVAGPADVFDAMVESGRILARELGGELCDETRSVLTTQAERHLRERIAEFVIRGRLTQRREGRR